MEQLDALAGMTAELEQDNPGPQAQAQAAAEQAQASEAEMAARQWGMLMFTVGGFAQMIAPELKPVYSEQRCFEWGMQANAVAEKYGWNGPGALPELALIASTVGFAVPTYLVVRQKVEMAKTAKDGSLLEKLAAWWQHRKAKRAGAQSGEVVAEAGGNGGQ